MTTSLSSTTTTTTTTIKKTSTRTTMLMVCLALLSLCALFTTAAASTTDLLTQPQAQAQAQAPTPPVFYSLDSFLEAFAKVKTTIFGQPNQNVLPLALPSSSTIDSAAAPSVDTVDAKNALTELLTPAQFAQLSLELTPVCKNHPELFNTNNIGDDEAQEQLALASRKNLFDTVYPNTVIYTITNIEDVVVDPAATTTTEEKQVVAAPVVAASSSSSPGHEEEDSIEIHDVNEKGEIVDDAAAAAAAPSAAPASASTTTNNNDKATVSVNNKTKMHYEFRFTSTNLEADLPKFDKQVTDFIAQQEAIQLKRHQLAVKEHERLLAYHRRFIQATSPGFKPSKADEAELAQQPPAPQITKLGFSRTIKHSAEEVAIKFNNFNNLLVAVCQHDQYRTPAEKRNVIAHAQLEHEIKQLQWKQLQLEDLLNKQNEDIKLRAIKHAEEQLEKKKQQQQQQLELEAKAATASAAPASASTEAVPAAAPAPAAAAATDAKPTSSSNSDSKCTAASQQQQQQKQKQRRSPIDRIFEDFENQFNLFQHHAMAPSRSLFHPFHQPRHSPFRFTPPAFPTVSFW